MSTLFRQCAKCGGSIESEGTYATSRATVAAGEREHEHESSDMGRQA